MLELGRILLKARKEKGMSQQDVANDCNIDRSRLGKIENGKISAKHYTLVQIAKALGHNLRDLLPDMDVDSAF